MSMVDGTMQPLGPTKLDPRSLNAEERAIVDRFAEHQAENTYTTEWDKDYERALELAKPCILARRAIFGKGNGEEKVRFRQCGCVLCICEDERQCHGCGAKLCEEHRKSPSPAPEVKCPNCGQPTSSVTEHIFDEMKPGCVRTAYTCKGPQPEPEKVAKVSAFPVGNCVVCGELVAPYNKHAKYEGGYTCQRPQPAPPEPAAREMPEAVKVYHYPSNEMPGWAECGEQIERGDSMPEWNHVTCERCQGYYRARREYEQKLAAQGRKVALGKVRRLLEELDAAEGKVAG